MKYIIEGVKLSGKTSLSYALWNNVKGSTVLDYRAFTKMNCNGYSLCSGLKEKLILLSKIIKSLGNQPLILTRAHLYPFALASATNQKIDLDFSVIDINFNLKHTILILLIINKDTYIKRLNKRKHNERDEKVWDKSWKNINRMQSEYLSLFSKSKLKKIVINTSEFNVLQTVEKINYLQFTRIHRLK